MPSDALGKVANAFAADMSDHAQSDLSDDPLSRQESLELVQAYYRISDPKVRKRLFDLLRSLANLPDEP